MTVVAIQDQVEAAVRAALTRVLPAELAGIDPVVRRSDRADFQSAVALTVRDLVVPGTGTRVPPSSIATDLAKELWEAGFPTKGSGPGFLNVTVPDALVWGAVAARLPDARLGVAAPRTGERVVVDYSAPNVAKEMHVGHLRSSVIGDALVRVLTYLGADVTRQNHIGDWGTQFGMLIQYLDEHPEASWKGQGAATMSALDALYKTARKTFEADPEFAHRSRARVVALQSGDEATLAVWRDLVAESEQAFQDIYARLGVLLDGGDFDGESRYNDALAGVVDKLVRSGVAVESDGAVVTFTDGVTGPDGDPVPLIVRKKDGGFGYAATDLATVRLRVEEYKADRILYVVDSRQALHFRMVFDTARRAGWLPDTVEAVHVPFGTVLGTDGRPFKTRSGDTVRLADLLDDAVARACAVLDERDPDLMPSELDYIANAAGIAAIKYADLSNTRTKDYVFDVDQMVAFTGNTGVYLQYAHARVRSILWKAADQAATVSTADGVTTMRSSVADVVGHVETTLPAHPAEKALTLTLDAFEQVLHDVADTLEPHRLCGYLFDLATAFTKFYDACPVLRVDGAVRTNRLALCDLTGRTLATGLDLLGITAPDRM